MPRHRKVNKSHKVLKPQQTTMSGTSNHVIPHGPKAHRGRCDRKRNENRYNLKFFKLTEADLELMRQDELKPLEEVFPEQREIDARYFRDYDFPTRPDGWTYYTPKEKLDESETRYFNEYVKKIEKARKNTDAEMSLFELNLETWRQLWRVLEFSDVFLIIVDVRFPTLVFPPSLYTYITESIKKQAILVLNKIDLVKPELVLAWHYYFNETYPRMPVVLFASYSHIPIKQGHAETMHELNRRSMECVYNIYKECQSTAESKGIDISSWEQTILNDMKSEPTNESKKTNEESIGSKLGNDEILSIGCIGFPNVGKSSLINALKGKKVVSVSRTPGHTKHFQTIFLTPNVRLYDCPGLVFPSSTPNNLQVLSGSFPIAQLKVPYPCLKYVAEHLDLPKRLKLVRPNDYDEWCAAAVAEAYALKRKFIVAKSGHGDKYRGANQLLRMCLAGEGKLMLAFFPPDFNEDQDAWKHRPEIINVIKCQNPHHKDESDDESNDEEDASSSDSCGSSSHQTDNSESSSDQSDHSLDR